MRARTSVLNLCGGGGCGERDDLGQRRKVGHVNDVTSMEL
jgi:hypothetical protein